MVGFGIMLFIKSKRHVHEHNVLVHWKTTLRHSRFITTRKHDQVTQISRQIAHLTARLILTFHVDQQMCFTPANRPENSSITGLHT